MGRPVTCTCGTCRKCKHRAYMREWQARNPGYANAQGRKHRERARGYELRKYHEDAAYRARKLARMRLNGAVRRGEVLRRPCAVCGAVQSEAHHDDYARALDVRWLCKAHHEQHHMQAGGA